MIKIAPYDPRWPEEFREIAGALRAALGARALRIDHIGSTSVPGLAAKDRIDVQVTVTDFARFEEEVVPAVEALGYAWMPANRADHRPPGAAGPDTDWEKRYFRAPAGQRPTNLHVRAAGRANQRYALLFRDYLRIHPASASAYAELKRRLAQHFDDTGTYADVKDPACDLIAHAAEAWAARDGGWAPGPSDA